MLLNNSSDCCLILLFCQFAPGTCYRSQFRYPGHGRILHTFLKYRPIDIIHTSAQEKGSIQGKIIEQTNKRPLAGATVTIKANSLAVSTDSSGMFVIPNIPVGTYTLIITHIGFQQKIMNDITVIKGKTCYV